MKTEFLEAKISCPTCKAQNTWYKDNEFRPFCSYRCRLIDLGEWANESRKIPSQPIDPLVDEPNTLK